MSTSHEARLSDDSLALIREIQQERHSRAMSEAREFEAIARFADLNSTVDDQDWFVVPGAEKLVQVGSDGTPEVAGFCTLELAAALRIRVGEAHCLLSNSLDIRHRFPQLWQRVMSAEFPVWLARRIASRTQQLDAHQAGLIDLHLDRMVEGMSPTRVLRLVDGLVLEHLPAEQAEEQHQAALTHLGVWVEQSSGGVASVAANLNAADAVFLEAQLSRLAQILSEGGVTDPEQARRAQALGILAGTPARALQLLQAAEQEPLPTGESFQEICRRDGQAGHTCGSITVDPDTLLPKAKIVVHLTDTTLAEQDGLARSDQLRPVLASWLRDLLGHARITVRPVIDQNQLAPSDSYECPPTMREAMVLRNPYEVFPWSTRHSDGLDLDHTVPWAPRGGVTHPSNLGPLSRLAHRGKTHGHWQLAQIRPGIYLWRSRLGEEFLTTGSRTIYLGNAGPPPQEQGTSLPTAA
ncbi:DUF222 domain-containing protein [Luteococcus sp. H138]|uniref:HNH endonuclease signature motif containing protein n=1 Tax=unclassified Luteococcus TaxID=2639923 RepID=UPI00313C21F5